MSDEPGHAEPVAHLAVVVAPAAPLQGVDDGAALREPGELTTAMSAAGSRRARSVRITQAEQPVSGPEQGSDGHSA